MKFEVLRDDFQKALQTVQHSVSSRAIMPVLSGVLLEAGDGRVRVFTTDLESSTTTYCTASVEEGGTCVVNHKILLDLFRDSRDDKMSLQVTGNGLEVKGEKNLFRIYIMPEEDFPKPPEVDKPVIRNLDANTFIHAVQAVAKAASRDEKRPTLTGIYIEVGQEEIRLVSTDSYRLAVRKLRNGFQVEKEGSFIVPAQPLLNFSRLVSGNDPLSVYEDENSGQLRFDDGRAAFTVRLIDGKFPRYEQFIPENTERNIEVRKEDLLSALKRASLVNTTIKLQVEVGKVVLNSESRDIGEGMETLAVEYHGEPVTIAFNGKFLEDGIASTDGESVVIGINEPLKPGVIKKKEGDDFIYIIMPIRI